MRYGLPPSHLADLSASLDRLDQFLAARGLSIRRHIAARAELHAVARELARVVRQLDTINRHRFRGDAASLAAWRSARDPRTPSRTRLTAPPGNDLHASPTPADPAKEATPAA